MLSILGCISLLKECIDNNLIHVDKNNPNIVYIYRSAGTNAPEGWYKENIMDIAIELANDEEGQKYLQEELRKIK